MLRPRVIYKKDRSRIQPSGAYAANLLGLSDQVPARVVFLTDAADRRATIGRQEIVLKRTTPKNMATAGRTSGLVIQAFRYLGREHVDEAVIDKLSRRLSPEDHRQLLRDIRYAPALLQVPVADALSGPPFTQQPPVAHSRPYLLK